MGIANHEDIYAFVDEALFPALLGGVCRPPAPHPPPRLPPAPRRRNLPRKNLIVSALGQAVGQSCAPRPGGVAWSWCQEPRRDGQVHGCLRLDCGPQLSTGGRLGHAFSCTDPLLFPWPSDSSVSVAGSSKGGAPRDVRLLPVGVDGLMVPLHEWGRYSLGASPNSTQLWPVLSKLRFG